MLVMGMKGRQGLLIYNDLELTGNYREIQGFKMLLNSVRVLDGPDKLREVMLALGATVRDNTR